jgi:hypothetical protein
MTDRLDRVLTEAYRDKNYEEKMTELYFEVMRELKKAETFPSIEYAKIGLAEANSFIEAMIFSKKHLMLFNQKVRPVIKDIRVILFGDPRLPSVREVCEKYRVEIRLVQNKKELNNGLALIEQLREAVFLVKQWGYEQGMFLTKPMEKKFGLEAISETMDQ